MDSLSGAGATLASAPSAPPLLPPTGSATASGLIHDYLTLTSAVPSPHLFRLWTAIHAIGAAGERRVWTKFGINRLYPNLFVFLVGPPGTGKSQAINPMSALLRKSQAVALAPNDMTKQGLLDTLGESTKGYLDAEGRPYEYHFLAICISELSNFMSKYDVGIAGLLTDLFDCPATNDEKKRGHDKGKIIQSPGLSFIMGSATRNLGATIGEDMWGSGFMARVIMVFADEEIIPEDMFAEVRENDLVADRLLTGLRRIGELKGPFNWAPEAQAALRDFRANQATGAPLHNRLTFYVTRRWLHLAKLCMIASLSDLTLDLGIGHFHMAKGWLLDAESRMNEIFKDMNSHEDGAIYEQMRMEMYALYLHSGRRPIHASVIFEYLSGKASSNAVHRMVQIAEAANFLRREAGTSGDDALYHPSSPHGQKDNGIL